MKRFSNILFVTMLTACQPPAQDNATQRLELDDATGGPSEPIVSPDTQNAIWSPYETNRLLFGEVGKGPLLSLECVPGPDEDNSIRIVRHIPADAEAQALFAFVGNGTKDRIEMDSTWRGNRWRWEGEVPVDSSQLEALTGSRALYATLPGGGKLELPASGTPGQFIDRCRRAPPL